jgi:hypothetical protein
MQHLLYSIEKALHDENHYAALALALALPDICGWIRAPNSSSKARYVDWFDRYLLPTYTVTSGDGQQVTVFLNGSDFYALRCAFLHEGRNEISDQRAQQVLDQFQFIVPPKGWHVHRNLAGTTLQLQVDAFCREIADATNRFIADITSDLDAMRRMNQLLFIQDFNGNPIM